MAQQIIFMVVAFAILGMAVGAVTARNLFHAALFLIGAFAGVAVAYVLLEAEFLAISQVIIYIGAIATLIVFAIMLSRSMIGKEAGGLNRQWLAALGGAVALFLALTALLLNTEFNVVNEEAPADAIAQIGEGFVGAYVIPFEVASVLLLAALIGAIVIARERHP